MKTSYHRLQLVTSAIALTLISCSNLEPASNLNSASEVLSPAQGNPISNNNPNGNLTTQGFKKNVLAKGLERPWGMASLPDGSILITERVGRVKILRNRLVKQVPIAEIPKLFVSGQGGLMDISLHPRFSENNLVYLIYSKGTFEANHTSILRVKFDGTALIEPKVIFEVKPDKSGNQHFGSRIVWLPDETMLISVGDGGNPPLELKGELIRKQAQKLDSQLGKILRLKDDGSIPPDNPFVEADRVNPFVWSYGHRNIQGLFADPISGNIWSTEHGAKGGDELNLVRSGKNYGWPLVTFSREYTGGDISEEQSRPDMVDPKLVWKVAIAPSGLLVYQGDRLPLWKGNLFVGGLVSKELIRIKIDNNNPIIQETIPIGQRVRDVRQGIDGCIYILTDEKSGQLIRLEPI
ncbi:PQQ-dependent sugar dehydrogenase [Pseudanabaena sp. FACHB-1998]|uniref:PQQ-dependent sugar dehydrogenase n=1 Tax=Pseudanabaena sp. FACHB-1998 TaxID=2692858 RepID=UPI0016802004|nr:PQQ-dependent sugar dehydrogenase [Pseudanabaena sp. FACHB-1998]MBD2175305.1 PQQ-dependent sugar dehydrogenase [Pseudanabaena sp. FACHB-1998]